MVDNIGKAHGGYYTAFARDTDDEKVALQR